MTNESENEAELLRRWQSTGDTEALEELLAIEVKALRVRIKRESQNLLSASTSASDAVNEAVFRFLERRGKLSFSDPGALRGYLWQAAVRILIDRMRKRGRKFLMPDVSPLLEQNLEETAYIRSVEVEDQKAALLVVLNLLTPNEQEVIKLVYFEGLTLESAGEKLGITSQAANTRLVRARQSLKQKLGRWADLIH